MSKSIDQAAARRAARRYLAAVREAHRIDFGPTLRVADQQRLDGKRRAAAEFCATVGGVEQALAILRAEVGR